MAKRKQPSTPRADLGSAASTAVITKPRRTLSSLQLASNGLGDRTEASSDDDPPGTDTDTAKSKRLAIASALSTIAKAFVDERDPNVKPALSLCFAAGTIAMGQAFDSADLDGWEAGIELYSMCLEGAQIAMDGAPRKDFGKAREECANAAQKLRASLSKTNTQIIEAQRILEGRALLRDKQFLVEHYLVSHAVEYTKCKTDEEREKFAKGAVLGLQCMLGCLPDSTAVAAVQSAFPAVRRGRGRISNIEKQDFVSKESAIWNVLAAFGQRPQSPEALHTNLSRAEKDQRQDPF